MELRTQPAMGENNAKLMPELPSGHMDKIEHPGLRNHSTQVNDIEQGKLNWILDPPPADRYQEVKAKYEGTQFRVEPTISTYYFWMNTKKAPFNDIKVRQAVNYAVDPEALERIFSGRMPPPSRSCRPACPATRNSSSTRTTWTRRNS